MLVECVLGMAIAMSLGPWRRGERMEMAEGRSEAIVPDYNIRHSSCNTAF